tara:strand:+ start:21 stop:1805 length:1785 start_codon:yes stop_codon:yes gene_type:complete
MRADVGTRIADVGLGFASLTEPWVRGTARGIGNIFGIQGLKDFGGVQKFDPTFNINPFEGPTRLFGPDFFKPDYGESYVPTQEDRARLQIRAIDQESKRNMPKAYNTSSNFDFRDEDIRNRVNQAEYGRDFALQQQEEMIKTYSPEDQKFLRDNIDPNTGLLTITPEEVGMRPVKPRDINPFDTTLNLSDLTDSLESLSAERQDLENRFAEEDIQRPADMDVDEITSLLNDIQEPSVDLNKTEADSLLEIEDKFDGLSTDELKSELDSIAMPAFEGQKDEIKKQVKIVEKLESQGIDPDEYFNTARNPVDKKLNEPGFFGSDRFLNFIRNVGAGLAESGQMGPGLVLGAAKAAEERAARDLAQDERKAEMDKLIAIEKAKASLEPGEELKPKEKIDLAGEINADYNDVVSATNVLEIVDRVEAIVLNEDTTSGKAIVGEFLTKAGSVFNVKTGKADPNGKSWDQLDSRTRAKVLLNQITQKNIRDILGESGKTISNLDRQIVENLVGSLNVGKTDEEVLETLKLTREGINTNLQSSASRLRSNFTGMQKYGDLALIGSPNIFDYINTGVLKDTIYDNQYASSSLPRTKITLAKD